MTRFQQQSFSSFAALRDAQKNNATYGCRFDIEMAVKTS